MKIGGKGVHNRRNNVSVSIILEGIPCVQKWDKFREAGAQEV